MDDDRPQKIQKLTHESDGVEVPALNDTTASNDVSQQVINDESVLDQQDAIKTTNVESNSNNIDTIPTNPISKNQQKRLRRQQEWEASRAERTIIRKEKNQAKKARRAAKALETSSNTPNTSEDNTQRHAHHHISDQLPITFIIDCAFDSLMRDNERTSLSSQITRSYGENRRASHRGYVAISNFSGKLRERFDSVLKADFTNWKPFYYGPEKNSSPIQTSSFNDKEIESESGGLLDMITQSKTWMRGDNHKLTGAFSNLPSNEDENDKEGEVIYLSAESPHTLTHLRPYSTYIIGGLVDKNREKGICYKRATQLGIKTARLPIGEYLNMQSRKVLATNHVVEIMLKYLQKGDWGKAMMEIMPIRKGGSLKEDDDNNKDETIPDETEKKVDNNQNNEHENGHSEKDSNESVDIITDITPENE